MGARIVSNNFDYINVRGLDLVHKLGWQDLDQRVKYFTSTLMFKCIHETAPYYLSDNVTMMVDILPYNTRSTVNMDVYVPKCNTAYYKNSFCYNGAKVWNSLPDVVKDSANINQFKYNYKSCFK